MSESSNKLILVGGPLDGQEFPVEDGAERIIGSDADCSPRVELGNVAPRHARLSWSGGRLVLADLGSATGTFVNGEQLTAARTLEEGDRICLGPPGSTQTSKILLRLGVPVAPAPQVAEPGLALDTPDLLRFTDEEPVALVPIPEVEPTLYSPAPVPSPAPTAAPPPPAPVPARPPEPEPEIVVSEQEVTPAAVARPAAAPPRPDYQMSPPSIGGERRPRPKPPAVPAAPRRQARTRRRPRLPRVFFLVGATAAVCLAVILGYSWFSQPGPALKTAPNKADVGSTITLEGTAFAAEPSANTVRIGAQTARVVRASATRLSVVVPELEPTSAAITVEVRGVKSNALMLRIAPVPQVTAVVPDVALPGQEVTLKGAHLAGTAPVVSVANVPAEVLESRPDAIRIRIPAMPADDGQTVSIVVRLGAEASKPFQLTFGRLPLLMQVSPKSGLPGDRLTLKGRGFAADPAGNVVTIAGAPALVLKAQPTELTVLMPPLTMPTNDAPVVVRVGESASTARPVGVETRSMAVYVPRFFAASVAEHVGHGHVLVSMEMAPVLVLSDKANASSTVERAEQLATALNGLVERQLRGEAVSFEYRESPPGVGVAGAKTALVIATGKDAAAYGETWDVGVRAAPATAGTVGRYWAALLQDYFTLFLARQRPTRVVELSPRGRVFLDLYAEAARRSGAGRGVPNSLAAAPGAALAKNLRDVALLLPVAGANVRAGTAVEGLWEGRMREGDLTRTVQLQIKSEGGRLTGALTMKKGALSMRAPLRAARYERGVLGFTVNVGGAERYFSGTLQGDQLTGPIHDGSERGAKVGDFSLRFID